MTLRRIAATRARHVEIVVDGCNPRTAAVLRQTARYVLDREGMTRGRLEIVAVADRTMRAAHGRWMGKKDSTDVLTFDLGDRRNRMVDAVIMICRDVARREARRRGTSMMSELQLYVTHGCLHLAGYDDRRSQESARMHRREDEVLSELRGEPVYARR